MDTETGSSNNLADVLKNGFSNGMKKPTTIPTISISTKNWYRSADGNDCVCGHFQRLTLLYFHSRRWFYAQRHGIETLV